MKLSRTEIAFSEISLMDDFGRVFFYKGKVFRAIYEQQKEHCKAFLESELFEVLCNKAYIPKTAETKYEIDGFAMVLEHETIQKSEPHHWSFNMHKDAILLILEVNKICNKYGYELKDSHPYNVFFRNNNPVFIDLGSIVKIKSESKWVSYGQFLNNCFLQLLFWEKGDFFMVRKLLEDGNSPAYRTIPMIDILESSIVKLVAKEIFVFNFLYKQKIIFTTSKQYQLLYLFENIINEIFKCFFPKKKAILTYHRDFKDVLLVENKIRNALRPEFDTTWKNYHDTYKNGTDIMSSYRFDRIFTLVKECAPDIDTMIDLAGNQGAFCRLMAERFDLKKIVLTDYDENAIDIAYQSFRQEGSTIQPYLLNFMRPLQKEEINYLKADIAFALAITHHLILTQGYLLPAIFSGISRYASKYVVIEFMPLGLWAGGEFPVIPKWYTVNWFQAEFERNFELIQIEKLEANRIVFIGKQRHSMGNNFFSECSSEDVTMLVD